MRLRDRKRPEQVEAAASSSAGHPGPAQAGQNEEDDEQQEDERPERGRHVDGLAARLPNPRPRHQRRVERDAKLSRVPVGQRRCDEQHAAAVIALLKVRSSGALDVAGYSVWHETFDATAGLDANPTGAIARSLLRHEQDDYSRVATTVSGSGRGAKAPLPTDGAGDVSHVSPAQVTHGDDGHLATGLCANLERQPIQPIDDRRIKDTGRVNDDVGGCGAVSPWCRGNLDLLGDGNENSEE